MEKIVLSANPSAVVNLSNEPFRYCANPPPAVPIHIAPRASSYSARMDSLGSPLWEVKA